METSDKANDKANERTLPQVLVERLCDLYLALPTARCWRWKLFSCRTNFGSLAREDPGTMRCKAHIIIITTNHEQMRHRGAHLEAGSSTSGLGSEVVRAAVIVENGVEEALGRIAEPLSIPYLPSSLRCG